MSHKSYGLTRLDRGGFTLIELVIIIVVLGILAAVAVPRFSNMSESSRIAATQDEMLALKRAIVGNPQVVAGGVHVDRGFEGDVGFGPQQLSDLAMRPGSVAVYDRLTGMGWNGPYIDAGSGEYLKDAWGSSGSGSERPDEPVGSLSSPDALAGRSLFLSAERHLHHERTARVMFAVGRS